jgi:hypothetical protein
MALMGKAGITVVLRLENVRHLVAQYPAPGMVSLPSQPASVRKLLSGPASSQVPHLCSSSEKQFAAQP